MSDASGRATFASHVYYLAVPLLFCSASRMVRRNLSHGAVKSVQLVAVVSSHVTRINRLVSAGDNSMPLAL